MSNLTELKVSNIVSTFVRAEDELRQAGWAYKSCGYWLDPVTQKRFMQSEALQIVRKRRTSL